MKPAKFAYVRPDDLRELAELLAAERENARILAGGMSLGAMLNMRLVTPGVIVDINRIAGLDGITVDAESVRIGAMVRQEMALKDPLLAREAPLLAEALNHVGHFQTRSRGTIGGSIAHADPSAELPLVLAVLGGEVELQSRRGTRRVAAKDFFVSALSTSRRPEEFVAAIRLPRHGADHAVAFEEFAMRAGDYAIVACACRLTVVAGRITDARLGLAGIGDAPVLVDVSGLVGQPADAAVAQSAQDATVHSVEPIGDLHASAEYRRELSGMIVKAAMSRALAQAKGNAHVSR